MLHVPVKTPAGHLSWESHDQRKSRAIPLELKVRDFEIPRKISLRSSFWMFREQLNRFYHLKEIALDDYLKWIDFALEHRINPIDVYEGDCDQLLDIIKDPKPGLTTQVQGLPNPNPDFTKWDKYIDHMVAGGANTINLGMSPSLDSSSAMPSIQPPAPGKLSASSRRSRFWRITQVEGRV